MNEQIDTDWSDRLIQVTGEDAATFLQGQLTADVKSFGSEPKLAAWCNPKGRVIVIFECTHVGDTFTLRCPAPLVEDLIRRLSMFRFRAKVEFSQADTSDSSQGRAAEALKNGIARISVAQTESYTPHMLNLDLLDAVSFDKGCYTGQEIVARTHYRGATKRRMLRFSGATAKPGDRLFLDEKSVGEVVNTVDDQLLAVIPLEHADASLTVNDSALARETLPYL